MSVAVSAMIILLILAAVLAGLAGWLGIRAVRLDDGKARWTLGIMVMSFASLFAALVIRGQARGSCPLFDTGELILYLAWALILFYLLVGSTYRVSLLGVFTAPVVSVLIWVAMIPGMLDAHPARMGDNSFWGVLHAALSMLSYGALGLGAVASMMFVVLNHRLKAHQTDSGLFRTIAPVHTLISSMVRLTVVGVAFLTVGLVCGIMTRQHGGAHFIVAAVVWLAYLLALSVWFIRGITPRRMAVILMVLFFASLSVFSVL